MRARHTCFQVRSLAALALLLCTSGLVQARTAPSPVRVQVYATHEGPNIVYHYKVVNNGATAIHRFVIGTYFDATQNVEYPQLERRPAGWDYGTESEGGAEILLAPTSTAQPPYWISKFNSQQGAFGSFYLEWSITPDGQAYVIPAGQSLAGFSVAVPMVDARLSPAEYYNAGQVFDPTAPDIHPDDDKYLNSNFKISDWDFSKNDIQNTWGRLEIADTTSPTLSVTLTPSVLKLNDKMVTINATISAKDDVDPNPEIILLSITANEQINGDDVKLPGGKQVDLNDIWADIRQFQLKAESESKAGRVYTVTYIANDASGNQAEVSTTVTVRHEQEEREGKSKK